MSLRYLLDTNIVSWPFRDPRHPVVDRLDEAAAVCAISTLTWHELRFGVQRTPPGRRRDALEAYVRDVVLATYPVLPYDPPAAEWHAQERARLERLGIGSAFVDGQIAAIAHAHGLVVVTHNPRHFEPFRGLQVEDWLAPGVR